MTCLGALKAGTYSTRTFGPQLSYTVPDGWTNEEDMYGNFLLLPPGQLLAGVNPGTADYIGVYTSVYPVKPGPDCSTPDGDITTPAQYLSWLQRNRGLTVTAAHPVTVGGLSGKVADVRLSKSARSVCKGDDKPSVSFEAGATPTSSDLVHGITKGTAVRLYLLAYQGGTLAIEIDDVKDAGHLDSYSKVAQTFNFHQA